MTAISEPLLGSFLKMQIPGLIPRSMDSKCLGEGPGSQYFQKSLVIWILCLIWGVSEGLSSFYRPLLDLPTALWISTAFILLFPLCHLHSSPDPEYSLIDYTPTWSHVLLSFYLQPSSLPNSDFYFDLVSPPRPLQDDTPSESHRISLTAAPPGLPHCPSLRASLLGLYFSLEEFPPLLLPEHTPLFKLFNLATSNKYLSSTLNTWHYSTES